jgi:hypothetical protein
MGANSSDNDKRAHHTDTGFGMEGSATSSKIIKHTEDLKTMCFTSQVLLTDAENCNCCSRDSVALSMQFSHNIVLSIFSLV